MGTPIGIIISPPVPIGIESDPPVNLASSVEPAEPVGINSNGTPPPGLPRGGTTGQIASKRSGADFDVEWIDNTGGGGGGGGISDAPNNGSYFARRNLAWSILAAVAASGAYSDLSGAPTLSTVATSGAYSDLSGKPSLGTSAAHPATDFALAAHTHDAADVVSGTLANARISQGSVTQWQANLSIACTQLTGNMPDARIVVGNVTQHQASLSIATSQLTGTLPDARVAASNVTQHQAALHIDWTQMTGTVPALLMTSTSVVASQSAQLALVNQEGDVVIRSDLNKTYIRNSGVTGTMTDYNEILAPLAAVSSIFGRTGAITAQSGDYTFAQISSTPTTLSGYGITDAETSSHAAATYETQSHATATFAAKATTLAGYGITDGETSAHAAATYETQSHATATYAPKATTLAGYGITDAETSAHAASTYETASHAASTYLPVNNGAATGNFTVPNQSPLNNSTKAANTAYVDAAVAAGGGGGGGSGPILLTGTLVDLNTSTVDTAMVTAAIPANQLATDGAVDLEIVGDYLNATAGTSTLQFTVKYGSTSLYVEVTTGITQIATLRHPFYMKARLANAHSATAQILGGIIILGNAVTTLTGAGDLATVISNATGAHSSFTGSAAENSASALNMVVSVKHSVSSASISFRVLHASCTAVGGVGATGATGSTGAGAVSVPSAAQTGTTYTTQAGDVGYETDLTNAAAIAVIVANVMTAGQVSYYCQGGVGQATFTAGSGVTLQCPGGTATAATRDKFSIVGIRCVSSGLYRVFGDTA